MWETLISHPLGRLSMRKFVSVAITLLVACFAYIIAFPADTYALDAEFNGSTLEYDGETFSGPFTATGTNPPGIAKDVKYYTAQNPANPDKGTVIYFARGADPTTATSAQVRTGDYDVASGRFSNLSPPTSIKVSHSASNTSSSNPSTSCAVDGVGWIVCSMSRWIAEGVDYLYSILTNFFNFEPLTDSGNAGSIYQLWNVVRNIANILFIIGFIIVIYGQMTSYFLSNYTIKKILPRIVVAAILVNTSYWICALGIDLSNFLGVQVQNVFVDMRNSLGAANYPDLPNWQEITAGILSGGGIVIGGGLLLTATGGTVGGLVFLLLGALIPVIFAVLVAVIILAARQALITVLVIIAPLAFVAYLLPNTEEWFTRWRKFFITLLIMFPAFSLIFGGAQLAGVIIIQNARDISVALLGLTVQVVPLFITPFLIKLSSGLLGTIAGLTNNKSKGVFDRAKNWTDANREQHRQRGFSKRPNRRADIIRPTGIARRLNNRTMRREGMTAAHKAMAEGRFAQTAAGRAIHDRNKNAQLHKHAGEAASLEAYNNALYGNPSTRRNGSTYRQGLHHQAHLAEGRAKLTEERAVAHAERDLQTQISSTVALRNLKVHADVDSAHANFQKSNVEAEGKLNFQQEVIADRALRLANVQKVAHEKEASTIAKVLENRAEANWERLTTTDAHVQHLKVQEVESADSLKLAESQWNSILADLKANAGNATGYIAGDPGLAQVIKNQAQAIRIEGERAGSFEAAQQKNFAKNIESDVGLQWYAGGDTQDGATSARAKASAVITRASIDIINDIKAASPILPGDTKAMATELRSAIQRGDINSARAHIDMLASASNPGIKTLRTSLETLEGDIRTNPAMLEILRHHINSNGDINAGAEDIASWARDASNGWRSFSAIRHDPNTWSNVNARTFASLKQSTQEAALATPGAINPQTAYDIFTSPSKESLKPNIRAQILALAQQIDPSLK